MLAWVDVEADGLDPKGHLLEVAIVVTDDDLQEVSHFSTIINPVGVDLEEVIAKCDPVGAVPSGTPLPTIWDTRNTWDSRRLGGRIMTARIQGGGCPQ